MLDKLAAAGKVDWERAWVDSASAPARLAREKGALKTPWGRLQSIAASWEQSDIGSWTATERRWGWSYLAQTSTTTKCWKR
jgi:hypothetical protein